MENNVIENAVNAITAVINALDNVEVKGKNNLNNLIGSISILEEVKNALSSTTKKEID